MKTFRLFFMLSATVIFMIVANAVIADDGGQLLTMDHYVSSHSSVPSIAGQVTELYVRERLRAPTALRGSSLENRVVLDGHVNVAADFPQFFQVFGVCSKKPNGYIVERARILSF